MMRGWLVVALTLAAGPSIAEVPCPQSSPAPECRKVHERRCTRAVDEMLALVRSLPAEKDQRLEARRRAQGAKMQALVERNRREGIEECRTWGELMGLAAKG